jgi:UDP-N-acetylmuramyl pentapeptide phosphotransferase/UDP-N-acetylglucosamine-1-phosphate transferase
MGGFGMLAPARDQLIWTTLAGSLCFFVIGLADDLFALSPWPRLAGQIAVSVVVWSQGVRIGAIDLPWLASSSEALLLPDLLSLVATVIWLVGITNAINWLDVLMVWRQVSLESPRLAWYRSVFRSISQRLHFLLQR